MNDTPNDDTMMPAYPLGGGLENAIPDTKEGGSTDEPIKPGAPETHDPGLQGGADGGAAEQRPPSDS